jgi:hypothetical protein
VEDIHTLRKLNCASEIQRPQFLLLRALWHPKVQAQCKTKDWLEEEYIEGAVSFLDNYPDWKNYLESLSQKINLEQRPFPNLASSGIPSSKLRPLKAEPRVRVC